MYTYIPSFGGSDTKSKRILICLFSFSFVFCLSFLTLCPQEKRGPLSISFSIFFFGGGVEIKSFICLLHEKRKLGEGEQEGN